MTDNEIIKALGKMKFGGHSCLECKHKKVKGDSRCGIKGCRIAQDALDLINRQKAEIERLKNENLKLFHKMHLMRAEAIRDVAVKLPELIPNINGETTMEAVERAIKHLVKEMVGDSND